MTPLEIFKQAWPASVPYVETVNKPVDTNDLPDIWGAAIYQPQSAADVTMGSNPHVEESGQFLIGLFTRSATGPAVLDSAVADIKLAYHDYALNGLHIDKVEGPHDLDPEADGEWWRLALTASYTFWTRRTATPGWPGFPAAFPNG